MRRISTATRVINKFGAGKDGFTNGDAISGLPSTDLEDVWFDHVQEEIANVIEAAGATLNPANRAQLLAAIQTLLGTGRFLNAQVFLASATYTPTVGMGRAIFKVVGGGAGSGGAPATGSGQYSGSPGASTGTFAEVLLTAAQIGASQPITIGAAGSAGATGSSSGGNGGTTSVGSLILCPGGLGSTSYGPTSNTAIFQDSPQLNGTSPTISAGVVLRQSRGNRGGIAMGAAGGSVVAGLGSISPLECSFAAPGSGAGGTANGGSAAAQPGFAGTAGKVIVIEFT